MSQKESAKQQAAWRAVEEVHSGMILGLGHGSTAVHALRRISQLMHSGELQNIQGVPCSLQVEQEARSLGISLTTLDKHPVLDLTIDGADQADSKLRLIKGGGGALLREKIVAQASRREIIVVDEGKLTEQLGNNQPVPVEVLPFGLGSQMDFLVQLGAEIKLRSKSSGDPFVTDQKNYILDCLFTPGFEPEEMAATLSKRAGIIAHGLFINLATEMIIAGSQGIQVVLPTPD
ncbi:MAG: ribose-5-phosphate isomerase RpiA [Desulfovermiculus sp.]|nr:ribose-5-phosphate isomerase RpiA [Desulfovermiculus sp.]